MSDDKKTLIPEPLDFMVGDVPMIASESTLERLAALAEEATLLTEEINGDTDELKSKEKRLANIVRVLIPNVMDALEMKDYTMRNGLKVSMIEKVQASISETNKPAAFAWLEKYHLDGIITTQIVSEFGKEKYDEAQRTYELLLESGVSAELVRSIHAATLKAFVKEQLQALEEPENAEQVPDETGFDDDVNSSTKVPPIPHDLFGIFTFKEAKITAPKKK